MLALLTRLAGLLGPVTTALTGINFPAIQQILSGVWANVVKYWRFYVPLFLICLQALTAYGWHRDHVALVAERHAHQADIKAYKDAQVAASLKAKQEEADIIKTSKEKANAADQSYSSLLDKYRASLMRYKAPKGNSGTNSDSQSNEATQGSTGPSQGSYISITTDDADTCAVNTARLQAAHDWAIHLGDPN